MVKVWLGSGTITKLVRFSERPWFGLTLLHCDIINHMVKVREQSGLWLQETNINFKHQPGNEQCPCQMGSSHVQIQLAGTATAAHCEWHLALQRCALRWAQQIQAPRYTTAESWGRLKFIQISLVAVQATARWESITIILIQAETEVQSSFLLYSTTQWNFEVFWL